MPTMPEEYNVHDDPLQPSEAAARMVFDWLFDFGPAGTSTTNDSSFSLQYAGEESGADSQTTEAAEPHWYSMVGASHVYPNNHSPGVFCTRQLDLNPKQAKCTAGTTTRDMKAIHHGCRVKPVCAQGQKGPIVHTSQAIDQVDLRAIWERAASECRATGHSREEAAPVAGPGTDQGMKYRFNPVATHFNPSKIRSRSFKFNPEAPEFSPDKFHNLEYLNKAVEETRRASAQAPRGSIEKRNAEIRCIAALKKRSRYLIAERTRQQEQHADDWDA
ncbi:hypothetical protein FN846DRAFT_893240 [Sphaerosporella brunnea]|uniref:Uncharacterized protein n=1 Tax=Sphaerosporella brunnea TaxID=1250544 RepID=A0A5J5ELY9_9PEZI|nr:hypothetical protein FN846DRAFT_893240 [Sphaerosporella brunnea]